ncbi:MAG TPA: YbaK/EbsC family protein, partial [Candidatus Limnocylindrales bacterium]|nr:YbaK/EbsC family protein [Candidatus Limnocylindrales bacterium]
PNARTIAEVCALLKIEPRLTIKSLLYIAPKAGPVLVLVRGDHTVHERKLARALKGEPRPATPGEIQAALGAPLGSLGPMGAPGSVRILADESLRQGRYVVGANREGVHLRGVSPGTDFPCEWADLQAALPGEGCPQCGAPLAVERVIEVGNIFKLGTRYSVPLGASYLDEQGQQQPVVMGCYGIGPARIAAAAIEQGHDADGIVWPWAIAPFHVHLVPVGMKDPVQVSVAEELYRELTSAGLEVLLDDRDERAGVKFKDADLLGCPIRITIGQAYVKEGAVEIRDRATRQDRRVPRAQAIAAVQEAARALAGGAPLAPPHP